MTSSNQDTTNRRKKALIIGNSGYDRDKNKLGESIQNATKLSALLKKINFTIMEPVPTDISDEDKMMEKVQIFANKIQSGDLIVFYFSGRGCQAAGENYLIPTADSKIDSYENLKDLASNFQRILERLAEQKLPHTTICILDCCKPYMLNNSVSNNHGLCKITAPPETFIQFSCAANRIADDDFFIKNLLENIDKQNVDVRDLFHYISENVYQKRLRTQRPLSMNGLSKTGRICLNRVSSLSNIPENAIWKSNAKTVAGCLGFGSTRNRLHCPKGLWVNKNRSIFIADSLNHRIMKYNPGDAEGERIIGKNIDGCGSDLLSGPSSVIFHPPTKSFIICDYQNGRVVRWSRKNKTHIKTVVRNVACFGLAIDDEGSIYISDTERHEIRRYRVGQKHGKVVAGGHGQGNRLRQLNHPTYICIGDDQSVYVSDSWNDRVVRWDKDAVKGVVVAGGKGKGKSSNQLYFPAGVLVDQLGTVYVADHSNSRIMRWRCNANSGEVIAGGYFSEKHPNQMKGPYLSGNNANELNGPEGLAFDQDGNLYVADSNNHRIQRFKIQTS